MSSPPLPPQRQLPVPESTARIHRRFVPDPVETTIKSNRASATKDSPADGTTTRRRFVPHIEESSKRSNRKGVALSSPQEITHLDVPAQSQCTKQPAERGPPNTTGRSRFAPQLIETTKRSRKIGDTVPALLPSDKTDLSPGDTVHLPREERLAPQKLLPLPPETTPRVSAEEIHQSSESRFSSSSLSRKVPRRQSFRVPDLAPIQSQPDSEESTNSDCPSLSTSPSAASDETERYKHPTRVRESCDDRFSGYLLALAARAAEKQLRDQAMAAYPNENRHEAVDHFAVDRESDDSESDVGMGILPGDTEEVVHALRRDSAIGWELVEMRMHQEKLEKQRRHHKATEQVDFGQRASVMSFPHEAAGLLKEHPPVLEDSGASRNIIGGWQKCAGLEHMRNAASPPMLGTELVFPKCQSPRQTKMESDQYPYPHKESGVVTPRHRSGLWTPTDAASRRATACGLWNGVCLAPANNCLLVPKPARTGLMTPKPEGDDSFGSLSSSAQHHLPPSPENSQGEARIAGIDDVLSIEEEIEREFHSGFVTQIYNYLSLGYPSVARKYDHELSKISKIPIEDLRQDDERINTKGYVGAPEGSGSDAEEVQNGQCGRWMALQLYIKEWAKQQPGMVQRDARANNDWGFRARKGSWAI
ncbi:hypothetical protein MMC24_002416 [Lignoscripta atroalba]|nr:hypothetical protein [Lignoscripta atroalba]